MITLQTRAERIWPNIKPDFTPVHPDGELRRHVEKRMEDVMEGPSRITLPVRVSFLVNALDLIDSMDILELGGDGILAARMAFLGHRVREVQEDNISSFQTENLFHRIVSISKLFGYMSDAEIPVTMDRVSSLLKPAGLFAFHVVNRDSVLSELQEESIGKHEGKWIRDRWAFDARTGRLELRSESLEGSPGRQARLLLKTFNFTEISVLLARAGLRMERAFGNLDARPFDNGSGRMVVIAKKVLPQKIRKGSQDSRDNP